jgi:tetratricopeptide (TPR) repeat protein
MNHFFTVVSVIGWVILIEVGASYPEPYRPANDAQILQRLSIKASDPVAREFDSLRSDLRRNPRNLEGAVKLATRYIEQSRLDGDPRFIGQAQATLTPWWNEPTPPAPILLLRATIRQTAHEFNEALADLDKVLAVQPTTAQAWLTKASILQVQARYDEARRACQRLTRIAARHIAQACLADIEGLTGHAAKSHELLTASLVQSTASERERIWILTILSELAARVRDTRAAEQSYTDALKIGVKDQYLLASYADFLLDQGRYREVVSLLEHETKADGLLLRLTLAEQALQLPSATPHSVELRARFTASRERGTRVHLREEARFTLALLHDPQTALDLARINWAVQKEPWDARLLLESALAAGDVGAAKPAVEWLTTYHVEDHHLQDLAGQVRKRSS